MFHKITDSRFLYHTLCYAPRLIEASPIGFFDESATEGCDKIMSGLQPVTGASGVPTKSFFEFINLVVHIKEETHQRQPYIDTRLSRRYDRNVVFKKTRTEPNINYYYILNISEL